MLNHTISRSDAGLTVYLVLDDGSRLIFGPDHPNAETAAALLSDDTVSEDHASQRLRRLNDIGGDINARLREVSTRFSYRDGKLGFDGDVIDRVLTRVIIDRLKAGDNDWKSYANFMLRLAQNPRRESRNALYRWIGKRHLTITEDGYVVGYKGVGNDGFSVHAGKGSVHRQAADATITTDTFDHSRLPNEPGSWVEFPRNEVDPDPEAHCSVGLHVGSKDYAEAFGQRLLTVLVDPAAVVMVPRDSGGEKMRVWQYHVTDIEPAKAYTETTLNIGVAFDPFEDDDGPEEDWGHSEPVCGQCGDAQDVDDGWCSYCHRWV